MCVNKMLNFFLLCVLIKCAAGANILFMAGIPSPSHHIFNKALAFALVEKGHNVTMVGNDDEKAKFKNFNFILMEGIYDALDEHFDMTSIIDMNAYKSISEMYNWGNMICGDDYKSKGLKQLMDYPKDFKFDLILFDITLGQCLYGVIDRFNRPPVVAITAFLLPHYLSTAMGNHVYPSYYPHYSLEATNKMSFYERIHSFLLTYGETFYRNYIFGSKQNEAMKSYFGENVRTIAEYEKEITILLSNTDPILDYPVALPPNIIPVGGMHIKPPKPLPMDLEKVMTEAKHGVIFFSLGTNIQSHMLGPKVRDEFLAAFSKLKETVIWKYEKEIENLPKNVVIRKWLPQNDILGHPKCKLFMSHGGALSTQEAMYHGVPIVGIPGFADQHKNVHRLVSKGIGERLDFSEITRGNVLKVVQKVLNDPKFTSKMKNVSRKYKDQPESPMERAIFWTEYVLRNGGAEDLALPARNMCFFQTTNMDVILFLLGVIFSILYVFYKVIALMCCSQKKQKKLKTK